MEQRAASARRGPPWLEIVFQALQCEGGVHLLSGQVNALQGFEVIAVQQEGVAAAVTFAREPAHLSMDIANEGVGPCSDRRVRQTALLSNQILHEDFEEASSYLLSFGH